MKDNTLLSYSHSVLYISCLDTSKIIRKIKLSLGWKEKYLSRIKILHRILRLGVRNAIQLDDNNILLFVNKHFYEVDLSSGALTDGYFPKKGERALNIVEVNNICGFENAFLYGAYLNPFNLSEVHVYKRINTKEWIPIYIFSKGEINHIHNIIPDKYNNCLWILTGDFDDAVAIWMVKDNFKFVKRVVSGNQSFRSCVAFPISGNLIYATDSPFAMNSLMVLEKQNEKWISRKLIDIAGSCIYGCRCGDNFIFSTVVEPDGRSHRIFSLLSRKRGAGIIDQYCHIYMGNLDNSFKEIYKVEKDRWPYALCQFGALLFPQGNNNTNKLLVYHIATKKYDCKAISLDIDNYENNYS